PIPVDLETIFQHWAGHTAGTSGDPEDEIAVRLRNSVLATDLLPNPVKVDHQYFDISGLARSETEEGQAETILWKNINTDRMSYESGRKKPAPGANLPQLKNEPAPIDRYAGSVLSGFEDAYHFLIRNRDAILEEGGLL